MPTGRPTETPSVSTEPTHQPSALPSISTKPTQEPSFAPSISTMPTHQPSASPSISTEPTQEPSFALSISTMPSLQLSETPSVSTEPTQLPSFAPSISTQPSIYGSSAPSVSTEPTAAPSLAPSISTMPTDQPSASPSISTQPTQEPSFAPSISTMPTLQPSASPSISTEPTQEPSFAPSISTMPTMQPSAGPSISTEPTQVPSFGPSISTAPSTSHPTDTPSSSPTLLAAISGVIFEDGNNDGQMGTDELRLVNIPVRLYDNEGIVIKETASDADGHYQFDDVFPGDEHTVGVLAGADYQFSDVVVDGGNQMTAFDDETGISPPITLAEGGHRNDVHGGVYLPIQIGNRVWDDLNANGIQDEGEPGLEGVAVTLRDGNGDVVRTVATDSNGFYRFADLKPGTYGVHFALPSGYAFTKTEELLGDIVPIFVDDVDRDANIETGATHLVDVLSGDVDLTLDAGVYPSTYIEGIVWHDLNANGIRETDEPGMEGVTVALYNDGTFLDVALTDSSGNYAFQELAPGQYYGEILPFGDYFLSPANVGAEATDSDFLEDTNQNAPVTLQSGGVSTEQFDAGLWMYASVGDLVFMDTNGDGIQNEDPLIGFPFPVAINLYDGNGQLLQTGQNDDYGFYLFQNLSPGSYEIEFIPEEDEIFSPPFEGNNVDLDSDVNPDTGRAQVTLVSGVANTSVDVGIIAGEFLVCGPQHLNSVEDSNHLPCRASYYPDWIFETQVCTNDGFDPTWMMTNDGPGIYLYRNKEECCENHFWWRTAQCMANEEYKFYRNMEICDTKIDFEDWELNSPADWTDTTLFDTKDECCANLFPYDYSGCMERSPVLFKFEFCLEVNSLFPPIDCQTADIYANVMEQAINDGLGDASDANITRIGDATLMKVDGSTQCGGSLEGQDFINDQTGTTPDLSDVSSNPSTSVCGVITTESYDCTQDDCLNALYDSIVAGLSSYVDSGELTANLQSIATSRLPPVPELQVAEAQPGSLNAFDLLLPTTMSEELGDLRYAKDGGGCIEKWAFTEWETSYDTLQDCCQANFNWDMEACCDNGGGCSLVSDPEPIGPVTTTAAPPKGPVAITAAPPTGSPPTPGPPPPPTTAAPPTDATPPSPTTTVAPPTGPTGSTGAPPTPATTAATTAVTTTADATTPVSSQSKFYATWNSGQLCDAKPESDFEGWEQPFDTLTDCCQEKFSYQLDECCASQGMGGCPGISDVEKPLMYYATWTEGRLCQSKRDFESWEVQFDSLEDCCTGKFSYSYDECCDSEGMGGCD
ncbi:hypothetical protein ACHAWF_012561 [Thalassiosira exigua]